MTDRKDQPFDVVQKPKHYNTHPSNTEAIEVCRYLSFNIGNAIKYLWRAGGKDGEPTKRDLEKSLWYVKDEHANFASLSEHWNCKGSLGWVSSAGRVVESTPDSILGRALRVMMYTQESRVFLELLALIATELEKL